MHSSTRKRDCTFIFIVCRNCVRPYSPRNSVSTVDLHWLLYSTRSKQMNIPQGCSSQPTDVRNISMLLEDGMSTCYWRAEFQLLEGGMSACYWRMEYHHVTGGRNVNMLLEGGISVTGGRNVSVLLEDGISTCYWRAEYKYVTVGQ